MILNSFNALQLIFKSRGVPRKGSNLQGLQCLHGSQCSKFTRHARGAEHGPVRRLPWVSTVPPVNFVNSFNSLNPVNSFNLVNSLNALNLVNFVNSVNPP